MAFPELIEVIVGGFHAPAVLITITILLFFFCISLRSRASKLPPGPFALPIIGNLHQVGKFPHRSLQQLAMKYGPIMYLRFGSFPTIVVSSPEMAKEILTTHDLAFASRPASAVGKHLGDNYKDIAFVPYGAYWRHVRKICAIHLFNARVLESSASLRMEEVSTAMRSIWEKSRQGKVSINVSTAIESLNFSIIWRIIFGTKYSQNDLDCTDEGKEVRNMLQEATRTIVAVNIGDHIPYLDWLDLQGIKRRMKKVRSFFDRLMTQKILDEVTQKSNEKNLVDALLEMAESDDHMNNHIKADNIKAILFDLINGGTATTSIALEWMMSEMVRNPRVAKKLQEEIESVVGKHRMVRESDLGSMEYLQCVVKESLRLYPSGPILVTHESIQSCTVGAQGFVIPPKTRLIVNAWAMGRDPTVWNDPLAFKPERFIDKDIDIKGQHFELLPFGAGRRGCPGALMAIRTMQLTLAQLMHCFDWTIEGDPSEIDMNEFPGTGLIRKENLFAIPALKVNCL